MRRKAKRDLGERKTKLWLRVRGRGPHAERGAVTPRAAAACHLPAVAIAPPPRCVCVCVWAAGRSCARLPQSTCPQVVLRHVARRGWLRVGRAFGGPVDVGPRSDRHNFELWRQPWPGRALLVRGAVPRASTRTQYTSAAPSADGTPRDSGVKSGGAGLAACLSAATGVSRAPSISPACAGSVRSTGRGGPSFRSAALFLHPCGQPKSNRT